MDVLFKINDEVKITSESRRVYFEFPYNEAIKNRLKSKGANWDSDRGGWWMGKSNSSLDAAIDYFKDAAKEAYGRYFPEVIFERGDLKIIETYDEIRFKFPFNRKVKNKLKRLGGRWNPGDEVWYFTKGHRKVDEAIEYFKDAADKLVEKQQEKEEFKEELQRRRREDLGVDIPYEYKDLAKERGGIWYSDRKLWLLPDEETKEEVLSIVREKKREEKERKKRKRREGIHQKIEDKLGRSIDPDNITKTTFSSRHKNDRPRVGTTYRKDGDVVEIGYVGDREKITDGRSFGYDFHEGYKWTGWVVPASGEDRQRVEEEERKRKIEQQAKEERDGLANEIRDDGEYPDGNHNIGGDRLAVKGRENIPRGGGSWFKIDESDGWIWYVRNNGADGDNWARNNVQTGGAGAIGWRVPYNEDLAEKIRDIDGVLSGEKIAKRVAKRYRAEIKGQWSVRRGKRGAFRQG